MVQLIGYLDIAKHTVNNKLDKGMTKPKTIEDLLKGYPDNKLNIRAFNAFYSVNNIDKPLKDVDIEYLKTIRGMGGATIKNVIETIENL
jgi:tRNA A22 N-methylase